MQLASEGANVFAVARRSGELQETARRGRGPGQIEPYVADLTVDAQVKDLREALLAKVDGVHALIHSAGTISRGPLETAKIHDLDSGSTPPMSVPPIC